MPARTTYEYAVIRLMPRIERGEYINVGVILYCRAQQFLGARTRLDGARARALFGGVEVAEVEEQLQRIPQLCRGGDDAGALGQEPLNERFRWLTAPRSTILQPSPVHIGLSDDAAATLDRLFAILVE